MKEEKNRREVRWGQTVTQEEQTRLKSCSRFIYYRRNNRHYSVILSAVSRKNTPLILLHWYYDVWRKKVVVYSDKHTTKFPPTAHLNWACQPLSSFLRHFTSAAAAFADGTGCFQTELVTVLFRAPFKDFYAKRTDFRTREQQATVDRKMRKILKLYATSRRWENNVPLCGLAWQVTSVRAD